MQTKYFPQKVSTMGDCLMLGRSHTMPKKKINTNNKSGAWNLILVPKKKKNWIQNLVSNPVRNQFASGSIHAPTHGPETNPKPVATLAAQVMRRLSN